MYCCNIPIVRLLAIWLAVLAFILNGYQVCFIFRRNHICTSLLQLYFIGYITMNLNFCFFCFFKYIYIFLRINEIYFTVNVMPWKVLDNHNLGTTYEYAVDVKLKWLTCDSVNVYGRTLYLCTYFQYLDLQATPTMNGFQYLSYNKSNYNVKTLYIKYIYYPIYINVPNNLYISHKHGLHSVSYVSIKSNQILFKVGNVHLKEKKICKKLFTRLYSITNNNKLYI